MDGRAETIAELRTEILRLQGYKPLGGKEFHPGLGPIMDSFPDARFPYSAVHEFLSDSPENSSSTIGFISGLLSFLAGSEGVILWIGSCRKVFPPALKIFGVQPHRLIFVDLPKQKDIFRAVEEALKCPALTAVVAEMREISFTESRRLQLAVEQSRVTGFIIRNNCSKVNTTACVSRWRITQMASEHIDGLPGVGFPVWKVELLKIRNGRPGEWEIRWSDGKFNHAFKAGSMIIERRRKAG